MGLEEMHPDMFSIVVITKEYVAFAHMMKTMKKLGKHLLKVRVQLDDDYPGKTCELLSHRLTNVGVEHEFIGGT